MSIRRLLAVIAFASLGGALHPAVATDPAAVVAATTGAATTTSGLKVTATVHPEAIVGFPVVVAFNVRNDTSANQSFPDLAARPHLVRFGVEGPRGKSERYNTPPAFDVATSWTLAPRSSRDVLLEIPSSAAFPAGVYRITVTVLDPSGAIVFAPVEMTLAAAKPVAGTPVWEPTIAQNLGGVLPWVQDRGGAAGLYLMQFDARSQTRGMAQYWLADVARGVDPVLSRCRPGDSFARYVYWLVPGASTTTLGYGRLEGTAFRSGVHTSPLPYPNAELLDRGVTDGKGRLVVPLWIPAPSGKGGSLKALTLTERGAQSFRNIVDLPARPSLHATAIDAASDLLLALVVAGGVDVYRVNGNDPAELPARGTRHWVTESGWAPAGLAFDTLPDAASRPGGLSLFALATATGKATAYKSQWTDLSGNAFSQKQGAWAGSGAVQSVLPNGYGAFYALSRDDAGAWWYQAEGGVPVSASLPSTATSATLFASDGMVRARVLGGAGVVTDLALGPKAE